MLFVQKLNKGKRSFLYYYSWNRYNKICAEKWKTYKDVFHLVWDKVKNVSCECLKYSKLKSHSQHSCDFTNDVKISRYNQLEIVLGDNAFSDTPVGTTMADE